MKQLIASVAVLVCVSTSLAASDPPEKRIWLIVTRKMFANGLKPLIDKRRADGFDVRISTLAPDKAIGSLKRRASYILLVGDDRSEDRSDKWLLRSPRSKLYRWRLSQPKLFPADMLLGDFDGDLVPEAPVGRMPVRTQEQLGLIVAKILAYESREPSLDDLRLCMWAGAPGYNAMIDSMAASMALQTIRTNCPRWVSPWMILSDASHPMCGTPQNQVKTFTKQLSRGGVMSILMGHGSRSAFFSMRSKFGGVWFATQHVRKAIGGGKPASAMTIFTCDSGDFTGPSESLAESLLLAKSGPVAVIAATTESHPLTNYFSGLCLLKSFGGSKQRLGDLWLEAQKNARAARNPMIESLLADVEGKLEDQIDTAKLRRDQMLMYAILGDPATKLRLPKRLRGNIKYIDGKWNWRVNRPKDATVLHVGFRPAGQNMPIVPQDAKNVDRDKLLARANGTLDFKPLKRIGPDETWAGALTGRGVLRLAAIGPSEIHVAMINLKPPTSRPSAAVRAKQ